MYKKAGATFTKWRAVIKIDGDTLPSGAAIHENVRRIASYARCAQEAGLVPIVEPEVLLEGKHSRMRAKDVIIETLSTLFSVLPEHAVDPSGTVLKTAMALSGSKSGKKDSPEEVAGDTLAALLEAVPRDLAGVVFLSGGQSPDQATANLAALSKLAKEKSAPWPLTFSYSRALQDEALTIWKGDPANIDAARAAYLSRLQKVSAALGA
jgi:fructose-bisphosphate aldolase class I